MKKTKTKRVLIPKGGNDKFMTPINLVEKIVYHFQPKGNILEPCIGSGNFYNFLKGWIQKGHTLDWCEIDKGKDFFDYEKKVDWIITNPPL